MTEQRGPGGFVVTAAMLLVVAVVAAYAGWRLLGQPADAAVTIGTDLAVPVLGALTTWLAMVAARRSQPADRTSWRLMSAALFSYFVADVLWAVFELSSGETPGLSLADAFYLLFYPLALAALLRLPGPPRNRVQQAQMVLDGLMLVVLGAVAQWVLVVGPALEDLSIDPWATLVTVAYPIGDLVLLFAVATVALRRRLNRLNLPLVFLGAAVASNMLGDLASGSAWVVDGFTTGSMPDLFFMGFWALAAIGAWLAIRIGAASDRPDAADARDRPPAAVFWLPYGAAALGIGLPVVLAITGATDHIVAAGVGCATMSGLVLIRQFLAASEGARTAGLAEKRASEARLGVILEQITDLVLVVDAGGVIRFASAAAISVVGRPAPSLPGTPVQLLAREADRSAVASFIAGLHAGQDGSEGVRWQLADRSPAIMLETTGARTSTPDDGAVVVLVSRDITERVRRDAQLSDARRLQAVGQLAGGIAHEFNSLLTAIGGYAELLSADPSIGPAQRDDLEEISRATNRAAHLTRQLLAVGRRQMVRPALVDLRHSVGECLPDIKMIAGDGVAVRMEDIGEVPLVLANPKEVAQILLDLVTNARDAMPMGGRLSIRLRHLTADTHRPPFVAASPRGWAVLDVTDTGSGMDAATVARLFEPFFTTKGVGKGTGLGLASAQGIMSEAGGWIEVDSAPGAGSRFTVHWPVAMAEDTRHDDP